MSKNKNKGAPSAPETAPAANGIEAKEIAGLKLETNFKVVDNTHEPSDTKPRTAKDSKTTKLDNGMKLVSYT